MVLRVNVAGKFNESISVYEENSKKIYGVDFDYKFVGDNGLYSQVLFVD